MKKNATLIVVCGIAVALALVFAVLGVMSYIDIVKNQKTIAQQVKTVKTILQETPRPVADNLQRIESDIAETEYKTLEAQMVFGHPDFKVLTAFVGALGRANTVDSFLASWQLYREANPPKPADETKDGARSYMTGFLRSYLSTLYAGATPDLGGIIENAKNTAAGAVTGLTVLDPRSQVDEYLLQALKFQPNISGVECNFIISSTINEITKMLKADTERSVGMPTETFYFSFEQFRSAPPSGEPATVRAILTQLRMVEFLVLQLRDAGITSIRKLARQGDVKKDPDESGLIRYTYEVVVTGEFAKIRDFYNCLTAGGIARNHFFYPTGFKARKLASEEKDLFDVEKRRDARKGNTQPEDDEGPNIEKVIGLDNTIEATLRFDYLVKQDVQK